MEHFSKITSELRDFFVNADFKNFTEEDLKSILEKSYLAAQSIDMIGRTCNYYHHIKKQN